MTIIIAIKPEYVEQIFNGNKKYEYRKIVAKRGKVDKAIIYETSPAKRIVGCITIDEIIQTTPQDLWEGTNDYAGITEDSFFEYFNNRQVAYAYKIKDIVRFDEPKLLSDYEIGYAIRNFVYFDGHERSESVGSL